MIDDDIRHPRIAEREQHQEFEEVSSTPEDNTSPPPPLSQWRADVLTLSARILFVIGLFMLIPSMIIALSLKEFWRLLVDVPILVLLGVIAFVPRLGFALRTTLLLGLLYGTSVFWLTVSGLVGSGRLYLVLLMVLAALLLNLRGALLVGLLALLSVAAIYWGFATATLPLPLEIVERMFTPATLTAHWLAQVLVSGVIVAAIVLTINRLQHSFRTTEEARVQLQRLNEQLEQRVTKRTAALMQANEHLQAEISERKQAEEAYTTLVEHSLQALQIFQYGRIVFTNAAATHLTGYSQEEILAFSPEAWPLLIHPDDRAELVQRSRDRLAGKPVSPRYECRFIHKDGTIRWIELLAAPITYQGRPATHMAYIDITERKAAEEAYRILVDNSLQGLSIHQDGRNVFANPAAAHIMGYTQDELLAMTPAESAAAIHPDDRSMLVQRGKDRQAGKPIPQRYSFRIIRKDGCVRWLEAFAVQTFYQGRPAAQMAYIDITERKQAEEALRESEERFTTFMTYLPGPAFIHDENGRVVFANRTYCQHLNRPPEQVIGQPFSVQVSPELAAYFQAQDQQVLATQDACIFEDHAEIDGQLQVFLTTKFPVQQADGSIHIGGVAIDITERKQAEEALRESERFIQQMTTTIPGILYVYDLILKRNIYSNRQMTDILGYTPEDVQAMGQDVMPTLLHPDDLPRAIEHLTVQTQAAEGTVLTFEYRMRSRDGNWRWLLSREVVFKHTADGQPQQILGIAQDITERKQAEESLRESEQRLKAIFDNAAVGIGLTDNAGRSIIANARGAQQLGYTLEELAQRSNLELTHPDDRAETVERMQRLVRGEIQGYRIEKRYFRKDGSIFWADLSVSAVYDDNGQIAYLLGIVVDITERKQLEHQLHQANMLLQEQAIRDPLTGLYNRRYLDETLPRELQRATRQGQPVGVIMLDIDHFKRVNDTYGHNVGDTLLRAVGAFLQHNTRGEDIACRYGGEEFTLVLPGASPEDACQRAEDLRVGIQALAVAHQGQTLDMVTASLGVAIFRMHGTTADALVSAADEALYQAKHSGRNRVVMADNTRAC